MAKQIGMAMPGSRRRVTPKPNVYTGIALMACVALTAAIVIVWQAGAAVGPGDDMLAALKLHEEGKVDLK
ncbi:MAG: hypothetical protein AAGB34_10215 [Planctomycetota bacterium]